MAVAHFLGIILAGVTQDVLSYTGKGVIYSSLVTAKAASLPNLDSITIVIDGEIYFSGRPYSLLYWGIEQPTPSQPYISYYSVEGKGFMIHYPGPVPFSTGFTFTYVNNGIINANVEAGARFATLL